MNPGGRPQPAEIDGVRATPMTASARLSSKIAPSATSTMSEITLSISITNSRAVLLGSVVETSLMA